MMHGTVPSTWLGWGNDWTAKFLLIVLERVRARGIDEKDKDAVLAVMAEVRKEQGTK